MTAYGGLLFCGRAIFSGRWRASETVLRSWFLYGKISKTKVTSLFPPIFSLNPPTLDAAPAAVHLRPDPKQKCLSKFPFPSSALT